MFTKERSCNWKFLLTLLLSIITICGMMTLPTHAAELEQSDISVNDLLESPESSETVKNDDSESPEIAETTEITELTEVTEATEAVSTDYTMAEDPDLIWIGWTFYESSTRAWRVAGGDGGYAFGRYQFDARSSLAPFLKFCLDDDATRYGAFNSFISSKNDTVRNLVNLPSTWKAVYDQNSDSFATLQTDFAIEYYYLPVKQQLLDLYGIQLDDYSAVLKGTVWSIAVRDGRFVSHTRKNNCLRSVTESYTAILATDGVVDEEKWLNSIYDLESQRHPSQKSRWNDKQRQAALAILSTLKQNTMDESDTRAVYEIMQLSDRMDIGGQPEILFEMLVLPDDIGGDSIKVEVAEIELALND